MSFPLGIWSKTQQSIAQSSCEAELMSLNHACNEATLVTHILEELGIEAKVHAHTDAKSAIDLLCKRGPGRMRHLHVKHLYLQQEIREGRLDVHKVTSEENVADILTKHVTPRKFQEAARNLGVQEYKEEDTANA